ncbi:immunoglobulin iota chain-like, partial [Ahaetulla prasina]|uniref:immunoglobulin iota chain-like n=1 Tax=Ahaetulla prasina TaxID=499056 RepID=UPI002647EA9C
LQQKQAFKSKKQQNLTCEGDPILLKCSYQGTEYSLQWYKQYPGSPPEFIMLLTISGDEAKDNFKMTLDTDEKTISLYLKNTRLKDSSVYFCAVKHSGVRCQDRVEQKPVEVIKEREDSTIACQFTSSNVYFMHWYRQYPGKSPAFLLTVTSVGLETREHFSASFDKKEKESHLSITKAQMKDAAVYFCAANRKTSGLK